MNMISSKKLKKTHDEIEIFLKKLKLSQIITIFGLILYSYNKQKK